ncbi:AGAP010348-PA, partial [Anopheles gambiae str. PEST]
MELLVQHIQKGYHSTSRVSVRKIYIDEDPAKEQAIPCPRCLDRNKQNMVRYLFLNLNEAIYKCEANDCMYPFRNFKFKNFEESTVYHYQRQSPDISFGNNFSSECYSYENSMDNVAAIDFSLDFLAGNNGGTELQQQSPTPAEPTSSQCLPAASDYANLSTSFDTGFIDDMLQDLFPSTVNPSLKVNDILDQKIDPIQSTKLIGRKLEKCLKVFEKPANISEEEVFKKPKSPESSSLVVEHITPTKLRIKNIGGSMTKTISNTTVAKGIKNKKIKPLEFVSTLNTLVQRKNVEEPIVECQPTVKKSPNCAKVQKMLNFIQRSMKTSEGKSCP